MVWAAYAVCVALNSILPANLGTVVMFVMLTSVIASATFSGLVGAFLVQKIFFTTTSASCYSDSDAAHALETVSSSEAAAESLFSAAESAPSDPRAQILAC